MTLDELYEAHAASRKEFEAACYSDDISREDFYAVRDRYNDTLRAYHAALGYGDTQQDEMNV